MKQSSKRLTSIGLALLFAIVALVVLLELVEPAYASFQTLKGELAGEQAFLATETQAVAQAQTLVNQYQGQSQSAQTAALAVPTGEDLAGALAQIYGLAANNGIVIQTVGISAPTLQAQSAASSSTDLVQPLGTLTFQLSAIGSYESLKSFLSGLATNVRIFDVQSLSISPGAGTPGTSGDIFNYSITVATYYQIQNIPTP
jgi:Tfp pilus assembly protein PilO